MPITRSAKKALRQSATRRARNILRSDAYKRAARALKKAAGADAHEQVKSMLPTLYRALDKAAKTRAISKNKASRLKSRLTKFAARAAAR